MRRNLTNLITLLSITFLLTGCDLLGNHDQPETQTPIENVPTVKYALTLESNNSKGGSLSGEGLYTADESITISVTVNEGFTFDGWFNQNKKLTSETSYTFNMPSHEVTYTAKFTPKSYSIVLATSDARYGVVLGAGNYDCGSWVSLRAVPMTKDASLYKNIFTGWYEGDNLLSNNEIYGFDMPARNLLIEGKFENVPKETGDRYHFGTYPQTKVTNQDLILNLYDALAYQTPSSTNYNGWSKFDWYSSGNNDIPFSWYKDITFDECRYRALYSEKYRPSLTTYEATTTGNNSIQFDNDYRIGYENITFYKFEPIEWKIFENKDGFVTLYSNKILDSMQFSHYVSDTQTTKTDYKNVKGPAYPNNYQFSDIRSFLNVDFFNLAFSEEDKEYIVATEIDNSPESCGNYDGVNEYACDNTFDMVSIPSYSMYAHKNMYYNAVRKVSDYAMYVGASTGYPDTRGFYWTRSPNASSPVSAKRVDLDGGIWNAVVNSTPIGVVPTITIRFNNFY